MTNLQVHHERMNCSSITYSPCTFSNETTLSDMFTVIESMAWSTALIFSTSIKCRPADTPLNWEPLEPAKSNCHTKNMIQKY